MFLDLVGFHLLLFLVYAGALGIAFLFFRAYQLIRSESDLRLCSQIVNDCDSTSTIIGLKWSKTEAALQTKMRSDDQPGLVILNAESIRSFLTQASRDAQLSPPLQDIALNLSSQTNVPYKSIRNIWVSSHPSTRPDLISLFSRSNFVFTSPKPREKSEELVARLKKLAERAERNEYKELVKDIIPNDDASEPFSSYKDQLGFGLHVLLTMFTGYLVGYATFRALFSHNPVMSVAGGILGLIFGMLVESLLFIIRSSSWDARSPSPASNVKKNQ